MTITDEIRKQQFRNRILQAVITSVLLVFIDYNGDNEIFWSVFAVIAIVLFVIIIPAYRLSRG